MKNYPISTVVEIDGVEAYATAEDLGAGRPTVMDGMSITWGRASLSDQPEQSPCSFTVREQVDRGGTPTILDATHVGAPVTVWAQADDGSTGADTQQWRMADQAAGALPSNLWSGTRPGDNPMSVTVTSTRVARCRPAAPIPSPWSAGIVFPPAPFNTATGAWSHIQRLLPGQTWKVTVEARMPLNGGPGVLYVLLSSSSARDGRAVVAPVDADPFPPNDAANAAAYTTITGTITLPDTWDDPAGAYVLPGVYSINNPASGSYIDVKSISTTPTSTAVRRVPVWAGKISNVALQPAGDNAVQAVVSCVDLSAELANITVGDDPWPLEPIATRSQKIVDLAGEAADTAYRLAVDAPLQSVRVQARDVDSQPAQGLLQTLAISAGAALWPAVSSNGGYLWMEDPQSRRASRVLTVGPDGTATIEPAAGDAAVSRLTAGDILRDPVTWAQDPSTVTSSFDIVWLQNAGKDPETGATVNVEKTSTRTSSKLVAAFGFRKTTLQTELAYKGDADELASRLLMQAGGTLWRFTGLAIDTAVLDRAPLPGDPDQTERLSVILDLLDGARRIGKALIIPDMPAWTPGGTELGLFVEGGRYELRDHQWQLELEASPSAGQGHSITWNEMPAGLTWDEMGSITWDDLSNVGAP